MTAQILLAALVAAAAVALIGQAAVVVYVISRLPARLDALEMKLLKHFDETRALAARAGG